MTSYLRFLRKLFVHKYYVLAVGLKLNAPLWRLIIHDWSKFTPSEHRFWYYRQVDTSVHHFDHAWVHHHHVCPHHWQYWVLREDSGTTRCLEMPESIVREMVADWAAAGLSKSGRLDVTEWYERRKDIIMLAPSARLLAERLVGQLTNHFTLH